MQAVGAPDIAIEMLTEGAQAEIRRAGTVDQKARLLTPAGRRRIALAVQMTDQSAPLQIRAEHLHRCAARIKAMRSRCPVQRVFADHEGAQCPAGGPTARSFGQRGGKGAADHAKPLVADNEGHEVRRFPAVAGADVV